MELVRHHTHTNLSRLVFGLDVLGDVGPHGVPDEVYPVARVEQRELQVDPPLEQVAVDPCLGLVRHVDTADLLRSGYIFRVYY
jgi:hypothetical protein